MPTIFDLVNAKEIGTFWTESADNRIPYLGATLFPSKKQLGLDLSWIKGRQGLPVALKPSAFDAKATLRDRIGISKIETEMPFFRESMRIGEKDRQELNKVRDAQNSAFFEPIIAKIYDDIGQLIQGAEVSAERMRMQLLSSGTIAVEANRVQYDYDYHLSEDNKVVITDEDSKWSNPETARPVEDLMEWMRTVEELTGSRPTRAICTSKTWNYLVANESIRGDMQFIDPTAVIVTDEMIRQYLATKLGLQVTVYNKRYVDENGQTKQFFEDDVFTLLPSGNLGNTYYGTTPEESDLMSGNTDAQVSIVDTGVAVTTIKEPHPVNVFTVVSAIMLPSFERIDDIFIATVA